MENGKDYIYEYSDLNRFYTRVKVLTGEFKDVIFEYGDTVLKQQQAVPGGEFTFNYIIYKKPDSITTNLRGNVLFETFVSDIIVDIITERKKDRLELRKAQELLASDMVMVGRRSKIHINESFYSRK